MTEPASSGPEMHVEWGVDHHDGCGPRRATDCWTARNWVDYWNAHREDQTAASLVSRVVTKTAWTAALADPETETDRSEEEHG